MIRIPHPAFIVPNPDPEPSQPFLQLPIQEPPAPAKEKIDKDRPSIVIIEL